MLLTLDTAPVRSLFVRAGSMIPTTAVQQYIGQKPEADIIFRVFPEEGRMAEYTLYEDDGESLDYQKDIYADRSLSCLCDAGNITICAGAWTKHGGYAEGPRGNIIIEVPAKSRPREVTLNGQKMRGAWIRRENLVRLNVDAQ